VFHLGRLLTLPANIKLDIKGFPGRNTPAYLASLSVSNGEKSCITLTLDELVTDGQVGKCCVFFICIMERASLERAGSFDSEVGVV
jgi:hypothetical protein